MYQIFFYPTLTLPDVLGRELGFLVSPLYKGGLRGVIIQLKSQPITFQTTSKGNALACFPVGVQAGEPG